MIKEKFNSFIQSIKSNASSLAFALLSGWMIALSFFSATSSISFIKVPGFAENLSTAIFLIAVIFVSVILYVINKFCFKKLLLLTFPVSFLVYGAISIALSGNNAEIRGFSGLIFCVLAVIVLIVCVNYVKTEKILLPTKDIPFKAAVIIVASAFVILSAYWIFLLWARTESFCAPCFDMGIFTQMYDNMVDPAHNFLPMTTCERGEYLSHFAVHFSPILYLLMPFCMIFEPIYVLVFAQILLVLSGVLPIFLICRQLKLSNIKTTIISLLFLLYPAMSSGSFYDFHENAFLAPLILWTLYFSHKKKWYHTLLMFVFALLVLAVKEDAALYVAFISLYVFFGQKKYIRGASMFVMTVAYFFFAISMIAHFQEDMLFGAEGNMLSSRYANIIGEDAGFLSLVKVLILNPALYAVESFTADKLVYALNMLLPIAFLPLITRKPSRWLLLGPFYVLNLVTDYRYQYDIGFQYSFGSGALLVYLAVINLADLSDDAFFPLSDEDEEKLEIAAAESNAITVSEESTDEIIADKAEQPCAEAIVAKPPRRNIKVKFISSLTAIALIFAIFASVFVQASRAPAHFTYARRMYLEADDRAIINEVLDDIDRDKSILATSMYLTHLYDADELYSTIQAFGDKSRIIIFTDIVILDLRSYISDSKNADIWTNKYLMNHYEIVVEYEGLIRVLERTESSPPTGYSKSYLEEIEAIENVNGVDDELEEEVDAEIDAEAEAEAENAE